MVLPVIIRMIQPEDTYALRHSVLWPDKPLEYVRLEEDYAGLHFGAVHHDQLWGVISLFVQGEAARFRKFAVDPSFQRQGVGAELLTRVMQEAQRQGAQTIACDARLEATGLYRKFGMTQVGAVFYKGPIAYVRMQKPL